MTDKERARKVNRFKQIATGFGISPEKISAFVGGVGGGGGVSGRGEGGETAGLIDPEAVSGIKGYGGAASERDKIAARKMMLQDLGAWKSRVSVGEPTAEAPLGKREEKWEGLKDFLYRYSGLLDPAEITSIYDEFHSKPGTFGPHKETAEEILGITGEAKKLRAGPDTGDTAKKTAFQDLLDDGYDDATARFLSGYEGD